MLNRWLIVHEVEIKEMKLVFNIPTALTALTIESTNKLQNAK